MEVGKYWWVEVGRIFWRKLEEYGAAVGIILAEAGRILGGSWKTRTLGRNLLIFLRHVAQFDFR